jgi:hypothetical protein
MGRHWGVCCEFDFFFFLRRWEWEVRFEGLREECCDVTRNSQFESRLWDMKLK